MPDVGENLYLGGNTAMTALPLAAVRFGLDLYRRRTRAVAEYWNVVAAAQKPEDILRAQAQYWTHMLEDYASAAEKGAAQMIEAQAAVGEAAAARSPEAAPKPKAVPAGA